MDIVGLSGSLREGSFNTALLRAAQELAPGDVKVSIHSLEAIPFYNRDVEREHGFPPPVQDLRDAIAAADAMLFASPEYNFSVTGVLKNAIDWASRMPDSPMNHKLAGIMGAGGGFGTLRSQLHLREILAHNHVEVLLRPTIYIRIRDGGFDDAGDLVDERHRDAIRQMVETLADRLGGRS